MATNIPFEEIVLGKEEGLKIEPRYFLQTAERAMRGDVARGLVELITNADDSYGEIEFRKFRTSGEISISVERKRNKSTTIVVTDKAEGMELEEMVSKLKRVGGITSKFLQTKGVKTRGLMGRGSKECVVFGRLVYKSIKNNTYSELELRKPAHFVPITKRFVTEVDRVNLDIPKGNGTVVILEVEPRFKIPSHHSFIEDLPKYYSLRDIFASPDRKIILRDLGNRGGRMDRLVYTPKEGNLKLDELFMVPGYPGAEAHINVFKSSEKIKSDPNSPYWEGGLLIQSNYAIHGVTGFSRDIENNPYFEYYFGRLQCKYIDQLAIEYELQEKEKISHTTENPVRIIDPLRSEGLASDHPFTKALYAEAARRIKFLIKQDEEENTSKILEIENKKTKERLKRLATEVSRFIKDRMEEFEDPSDENYLEDSDIPSGGMVIIPMGVRVPIGEVKRFYVYIKPTSQQPERKITLSTDTKSILLNSDVEGFLDRGNGIFHTSFSVMGMKYANNVKIKISWSGVARDVSVSVVKKEVEHPFVEDFGFEKDEYRVRRGKQKDVLILASWPQFVHGEVDCLVRCDSGEFVTFIGKKMRLKHVIFDDGTEMGIGKIKVYGKKVGGPTTIKTSLQNKEITTKIYVIPPKELGHNIEIRVVDDDLGEQRAVWDGNLLKIGGRHNSIKRYLGPPPDFTKQDSVHFRLLLAELIADNVARRILELNAMKNIREYEDLDVSGFYNKHRRYMNDFLEIAHRIQIPDRDIDAEG